MVSRNVPVTPEESWEGSEREFSDTKQGREGHGGDRKLEKQEASQQGLEPSYPWTRDWAALRTQQNKRIPPSLPAFCACCAFQPKLATFLALLSLSAVDDWAMQKERGQNGMKCRARMAGRQLMPGR